MIHKKKTQRIHMYSSTQPIYTDNNNRRMEYPLERASFWKTEGAQ